MNKTPIRSEDEIRWSKYVNIFLVVSGYWVVSITTVFVNKILLSSLKLNAPIFIALTQTFITFLICYGKKVLSRKYPSKFSFPDINVWDWHTIKAIFPVSLMFTSMIAMNTLCLKYVSVSFYYIGRSLTTIFNVSLTYLILGEKTSKGCVLCCVAIIFGFYLGVDQENIEGSLSVSGTIFGVLASLFLSLFSIFTKKVMPKVNGEIWALSYANNVYASILFFPIIIINDEIHDVWYSPSLYEAHFWFMIFIGGLCGFAIGFFTSLQIKYTSALTHNISGTAKACAQTVMATWIYQESKSLLWWSSNFIVLFASAIYARLKQVEMDRRLRLDSSNKQVLQPV